jgi:probable phosphoglycerate mutase
VELIWIRHAQARGPGGSYGTTAPLSKLGQRQAAATARALSGASAPTAVYSSPFERARQTAAPTCQALGLPLLEEDGLREFEMGGEDQPGAVDSLPGNDLPIWLPEHRGHDTGETLLEFGERVATFCDALARRHVGERIALFSHAGTIDAAFRWALAIPAHAPWQHELDLRNASISELVYWPDGRAPESAPRYAIVRRVADVAHLDGELVTDF